MSTEDIEECIEMLEEEGRRHFERNLEESGYTTKEINFILSEIQKYKA